MNQKSNANVDLGGLVAAMENPGFTDKDKVGAEVQVV